jgi:putative aldouronate transport system substrate-binding protein
MKRFMSIVLLSCLILTLLSGCSQNNDSGKEPTPKPSVNDATVTDPVENVDPDGDGVVDGKFLETREITVEVYDRDNDGGSTPEDNFYTEYIKEGMLRDHNVQVTFVPVPRWTEVEQINNLLASGSAPDVCVTYDYSTIQTYAGMGGVTDLSTYVEDYKDLLPNLWGWLGETNIYWDRNPTYGTIWALEAKLAVMNRTSTFVREDWLKKVNISEPTTIEEFEAMLVAFRDNAELLLGADADKIVPLSISFDVGWRADHLLGSFIPNDITDKDYFMYGFDDRKLLEPGIKEGVRVLNKWYNEDLIWKDFALYPAGDTTEDNMMKAGYVGAFMHNWDYPYRNGENSIQYSLTQLVSPDAAYIAVEPFKNDAGVYKKFLAGPVDRKVFLPSTNDEPLASLMYLDWISNPENRQFIQIGEEGVTHEKLEDGSVRTLAATGEKIMNSPNNIDYTITCNGLDLGDTAKTVNSIANGYANVDSRFIQKAFDISTKDGRIGQNVNVGTIKAEEGMGPALTAKRDTLLDQAVVAAVDKFDNVFDSGLNDYLSSGGQAIIDERKAAWELTFGDVTSLPVK